MNSIVNHNKPENIMESLKISGTSLSTTATLNATNMTILKTIGIDQWKRTLSNLPKFNSIFFIPLIRPEMAIIPLPSVMAFILSLGQKKTVH
jgi:hypothetical protein